MKFISAAIVFSTAVVSVSAGPLKLSRRAVDPALVPQFGIKANVNPTGTGDCDGVPNAQGVPIKIPCSCPPDRDSFIQSLNANVAVGHAVNNPTIQLSFPTDNSKASQLARLNAATITLQNLKGPGVGCPSAATTFNAQAQAIQNAAGGVDPNLVPQFGITAGKNPTGTGDCDGVPNAQGVPIKIPCSCPPDRASFIQSLNANVAAGHAVNNPTIQVSFPSDNSKASQLARLNAATVQAIQNGTPAPSAPAPPVAPAPPAAGGVDPNLVPQFGLTSGLNPTGTGDCDGIPNAQGVPIKIPCSCPPDRASFIQSLNANVAAGHAVNNPTIKVSFPTDDSKASKLARIDAATVTLQNLRGPGQGCPAASTTFNAQRAAIQNGP